MRRLGWLVILLCVSGCDRSPSAPSSKVLQSGTIADLQAAKDIVAWNMAGSGGSTVRRQDMICRWDPPVRVYIGAGSEVDRARVLAALEYLTATTGITYTLNGSSFDVSIGFGQGGLPDYGGGGAAVTGVNPNNSAKSGRIVYEPGGGQYCAANAPEWWCLMLYRHELGHIFGIFSNTNAGGVMGGGFEVSEREKNMLAALYSLPHGARVSADGTWQVLAQ